MNCDQSTCHESRAVGGRISDTIIACIAFNRLMFLYMDKHSDTVKGSLLKSFLRHNHKNFANSL